MELRGRIFGAFEIAGLERDPTEREPWLTCAIVGAGPTGVELAVPIAELSRRGLRNDFRTFDAKAVRIVLLDAVDTVLPTFPERLQERAKRDLEKLGIELRLGTRVVGVDATGLDLAGGARIDARTKIWAAGVQASPLGRILAERGGATVDRSGRVEVSPDCSLPSRLARSNRCPPRRAGRMEGRSPTRPPPTRRHDHTAGSDARAARPQSRRCLTNEPPSVECTFVAARSALPWR